MNAMVIVPTYNERENIDSLLEELLRCDADLHVVVVDDNSPDGTGAIADAWSKCEARVHVIHRPGKLGLGTAYIAGFTYAMSFQPDTIITMDADFSHHPSYIPSLLKEAEHADLVIGSRYVSGGGTRNCSIQRKLLSRGANFFAKLLLGLRARDCTAGFRCYRRTTLQAIPFEQIRSNGYSYLVEMLYAVQSRSFRVAEVAIIFEDRRFGTSKISRNEIRKAINTVLRLFITRLSHRFSHVHQEDTESSKIEVSPDASTLSTSVTKRD